MVKIVLRNAEFLFDFLKSFWESHRVNKFVSSALAFVFVIAVLIGYLDHAGKISLGQYDEYFSNPFFAIEVVFTLLLIVELLSLVFVLPKSVAKSVGKQFELLSLIFIRSGFKEFGHLHKIHWEVIPDELYHMFAYALAALAMFIIMGFNYRLQMHSQLKVNENDQHEFVQTKKVLALLLLIAFIVIGFSDGIHLIKTGNYLHSFDKFYTVLIFSDIVIVLIALRYTLSYYRIFRYSAFVLATIFIRLALTTEIYYNVLIGVGAALYVLVLTYFYNHFLKSIPDPEKE
jgi:uncharacterized membrane protein YedE/YeeE